VARRLLALAALILWPVAHPLRAEHFVVSTTGGGDCGSSGACSLTRALELANARSGEHHIVLAAGVYRVGGAAAGRSAAGNGGLVVSGRVRLRGAGRDATVLEGDGKSRVLFVGPGATLELSAVTVRNGRASGDDGNGGGILVQGRLVLTDSTVTRNHADYEGGGIDLGSRDASAVITRSVVSRNRAGYGGGGIDAYGSLEVVDSEVSENWAGYEGGGIDVGSGTLTMRGSTVTGNTTDYQGGGIALEQSWLGQAATTLTGCTVTANSAGYDGGGISNYGRLTVIDSTIDGNTSLYAGGGIGNNGTLTMRGSTVSNNTTGGNGPDAYGEGGGIAHVTWWGGRATATITNSTVSGNRSFFHGGGMLKSGEGRILLRNVTITNNTADADGTGEGDGGGVFARYGGVVTVGATVIAGNRDSGAAPDCAGTLTSLGYNVVGTLAGCALVGDEVGNQNHVDARLSALGPFGGATQTHLPLEGSALLDVFTPIVPGSCGGAFLGADQRGVTRPQSTGCDVGAVERACAGDPPDLGCESAVAVKCYDAGMDPGATFLSRTLSVTDAIGSTAHELVAPAAACTPAGTDGNRATGAGRDLLCYRARGLAAGGRPRVIWAANEFGTERLKLVRPRSVCVAEETAETRETYKCYRATRAARGPRFAPRTLVLADVVEARATLVIKPELLCTRADPGGSGVETPQAAIECYRIRNASGEPPSPARHLTLDGQSLVTRDARWLCLPTFTDLGAQREMSGYVP
jgi:hypothetical protein